MIASTLNRFLNSIFYLRCQGSALFIDFSLFLLQLLQRSDEIVRSELQATTSEFGTSASSSDIACSHAAAVEPPHRKSLCSPVNVTAAIGLSSPMSLRCSPAPASTLHVKDHAPSSSAPSSLEQLAALPIDELQPHRAFSAFLQHPIYPVVELRCAVFFPSFFRKKNQVFSFSIFSDMLYRSFRTCIPLPPWPQLAVYSH